MRSPELLHPSKSSQLVVLIDPDKFEPALISQAKHVSFFLVGGSKLKKNNLGKVIHEIKKRSSKPVIIFPGDERQVHSAADGILLLSLISGRNPEYLIGKHVKAANAIKRSRLKTLPTGYILVNGNKRSTTQKITGTHSLSNLKTITDTALAGEQLGMKAIYLEAGSGAKKEVNSKIINAVKRSITLPLFVGGGIDSYAKAKKAASAGADFVVIGNALEKNIHLLPEIEKAFS
jgi:phosphoglycerol geranylgeranyltransferase